VYSFTLYECVVTLHEFHLLHPSTSMLPLSQMLLAHAAKHHQETEGGNGWQLWSAADALQGRRVRDK
jgi:hypothetical protein